MKNLKWASGVMVLLLELALAIPAQAAWYNASWNYRKAITIDHTKVSATLTDFPVLIVAMTCLNGLFQDAYTESMAEALLLAPKRGAIAVFASSGLTEPEPQALMNREFIHLLFNRGFLTVGQAVTRAKAATTDPDVRKTWIFFGDPTTRLKY